MLGYLFDHEMTNTPAIEVADIMMTVIALRL